MLGVDDIYEDIQRPDCCESSSWSSSEFESCDEQSEGEAVGPAGRSKVTQISSIYAKFFKQHSKNRVLL